MRTSAAGNKALGASAGFTLLELLVVVGIIALGSAVASLALRDRGGTGLERDAQRLAAQLEAARARSRATGVEIRWEPVEGGYRFSATGSAEPAQTWLSEQTRATGSTLLVLGPDPLIPPQQVDLRDAERPDSGLRVRTDGLRPFFIEPAGTAP